MGHTINCETLCASNEIGSFSCFVNVGYSDVFFHQSTVIKISFFYSNALFTFCTITKISSANIFIGKGTYFRDTHKLSNKVNNERLVCLELTATVSLTSVIGVGMIL